jgi:hypothetical protein
MPFGTAQLASARAAGCRHGPREEPVTIEVDAWDHIVVTAAGTEAEGQREDKHSEETKRGGEMAWHTTS